MIVGTPPAGRCGVYDYVVRLTEELARVGVEADVVEPTNRSIGARHFGPADAIWHRHYPSVGEGRRRVTRLGPRGRRVLTLHEYSYAHPLRRAWALRLAADARLVVATTDAEAAELARLVPKRRISVVPIASSIVPPIETPTRSEDPSLKFFGLLAPGKGLEQFLHAGNLLLPEGWEVAVLGATASGSGHYVESQQKRSDPRIRWTGDLPEEMIAMELSSATAVYLPFPDGASARRSSLGAALNCGATVLAPFGDATTTELTRSIVRADTPEEAVVHARRIRSLGRTVPTPAGAGQAWTSIAMQYRRIYLDLVGCMCDGQP